MAQLGRGVAQRVRCGSVSCGVAQQGEQWLSGSCEGLLKSGPGFDFRPAPLPRPSRMKSFAPTHEFNTQLRKNTQQENN
jgi:hypothetical protein